MITETDLKTKANDQLHTIFDGCDGDLVISIDCSLDKRAPTSAFFTIPGGIDKAAEFGVSASDRGADTWFRLCPMAEKPESGRGKADASVSMPCIWADLDCHAAGIHESKQDEKPLPPDIGTAVEIATTAIPLKPTMIVNSGYGAHVYWVFTEPMSLQGSAEREAAVCLLDRAKATLAYRFGEAGYSFGTNTFDLARVFRLAGTINWKNRSDPKPVEIVPFEPGRPRFEPR